MGELSPVDVVEHALATIAALDARVNAFTVTLPVEARRAARHAAERAQGGERAPLLGVPISVKDNIWMRGAPATNGSVALRDFVAPVDSVVVERLRAAGAVIVGKTNNPEFLLRGYTDNALFGPTRNPWDLGRTAGGSSGGSAAAVAAGMTPLSLGTDAGGSIRTPACFCGVVGLKPTFGLVPLRPAFRGWPTLTTAGPIARTVADAALLLDVIAGIDPADDLSVPKPPVSYLAEALRDDDLGDLRVAYTEDMGFAPVDPEVREAFRRAVSQLAGTGCQLVEACPDAADPAELWWRIGASEIYASEGPLLEHFEDMMTEDTPAIVRSGEDASAKEYLDAQYDRSCFARRWAEFFREFDVLLAPATQTPAFPVGQGAPSEVDGVPCDPLFEDWCSLIYVANLTGQPSLTVPIGFSRQRLPLGMQIIGRRFEDQVTLRLGAAWQRLHLWQLDWPPFEIPKSHLTYRNR